MIRVATDDDWPAILDVHRRAFGRDDEARIADEVRAGDTFIPGLSLVAMPGDQVAGHVLTSWVGLEGSDRRLLLLGPIGVLPELQGQGIGSALVRASPGGCARRGCAATAGARRLSAAFRH